MLPPPDFIGNRDRPFPVEKRGESRQSTLTGDPGSYPTEPPTSKHNYGRPTIAGSEAGFIGLVVGLGVLVIACSVAIYFLLKRRRANTRIAHGSHEPLRFPKPSSMFSGSKRQKGWVQTGDEDGDEIQLTTGDGTLHESPYSTSQKTAFSSTSTVRLEAPGAHYTDPFAARSSNSFDNERHSEDTGPHRPYTDAAQSPTTPTFEGGTKFKEQL